VNISLVLIYLEKTLTRKKLRRPPKKKKKKGKNKEPYPEEQEGMPQHQHCPPAKHRGDRNPKYHAEQQKDVA
jgi:hypothetical protein